MQWDQNSSPQADQFPEIPSLFNTEQHAVQYTRPDLALKQCVITYIMQTGLYCNPVIRNEKAKEMFHSSSY